MRQWYKLILVLCALYAQAGIAAVSVVDDTGAKVSLAGPAQRIISLAPHITEILFAAGAGSKIVGVVSYSDYPPAATKLPVVGSYNRIDLERILSLKPDLIVGWQSGNNLAQLTHLREQGFVIYMSEPKQLEDIARTIENLGTLAATTSTSEPAAKSFRERQLALQQKYANRPHLRGFYQIWHQPIMTINGQHLISKVMQLCGVDNVFGGQPMLVPSISQEAVIAANPQIITAGGMAGKRPEWLDAWQAWPQLAAVKYHNLFNINPDIIQRLSPRILDGAEEYCRQADEARARLRL